jgi:hypothetical protein
MLPPLDGAPGPARRLSSARMADMVSSIVDAASAAPPSEPMAPRLPTSPLSPFDVTRTVIYEPAEPAPRRIARRGVAMAAALVVASVGSAAAGVWIAMRERPPAAEPPPSAIAPAAEREPAGRARDRIPAAADTEPAAARIPAADEPDRVDPEQVDEVAEVDDSSEQAVERPRRRPRAKRKRPRPRPAASRAIESAPRTTDAPDTAVEPEATDAPDQEEPPIEEPEPEAERRPETVVLPDNAPVEDIVALANQRRKEKRWRAAEELYERVMRDHAGTDAATIATVASASLHLDHLADPAGALSRFHRALRVRPRGPLAEEARWGVAETHRALGDEAAERAALRRFLSAHPGSVNAARARQRLAELGAQR